MLACVMRTLAIMGEASPSLPLFQLLCVAASAAWCIFMLPLLVQGCCQLPVLHWAFLVYEIKVDAGHVLIAMGLFPEHFWACKSLFKFVFRLVCAVGGVAQCRACCLWYSSRLEGNSVVASAKLACGAALGSICCSVTENTWGSIQPAARWSRAYLALRDVDRDAADDLMLEQNEGLKAAHGLLSIQGAVQAVVAACASLGVLVGSSLGGTAWPAALLACCLGYASGWAIGHALLQVVVCTLEIHVVLWVEAPDLFIRQDPVHEAFAAIETGQGLRQGRLDLVEHPQAAAGQPQPTVVGSTGPAAAEAAAVTDVAQQPTEGAKVGLPSEHSGG